MNKNNSTVKPTHTPGPWTYTCMNAGEIGSKDKVYVDGPGGHIAIACRIAQNNGRNTFGMPVNSHRALPEVKANARLIAAAPELLAACIAVQEWMIRVPTDAASEQAYAKVVSAIAKAEGK